MRKSNIELPSSQLSKQANCPRCCGVAAVKKNVSMEDGQPTEIWIYECLECGHQTVALQKPQHE
jgi:transcription elongation factor Elf1